MATFEEMKPKYENWLRNMQVRPEWQIAIDGLARKIIANKSRYKAVSDKLAKDGNRIPWQFIGVVHARESGLDFGTHLHNGDPLTRRTYHVPAGRPLGGKPPFTWEYSAEDALRQESLENITDWSMPMICYQLERYNGWGYQMHGVPSAYLWSGTNIYQGGKYEADGVWNSNYWDIQEGAMVVLLRILALDVSEQRIVQGSTKLTGLRRVKTFLTATFGSYFTADYFNMIPDYLNKVNSLGLSKGTMIAILLAVVGWVLLAYVEWKHQQDYANGNYTPSKLVENNIDPVEHSL